MKYVFGFLKECDVRVVMGDSFISIPWPNINMPDYSRKPLMDCTYSRGYFHSVESTLEPVSHAIFLQNDRVWLCGPVVLTFGIQILHV